MFQMSYTVSTDSEARSLAERIRLEVPRLPVQNHRSMLLAASIMGFDFEEASRILGYFRHIFPNTHLLSITDRIGIIKNAKEKTIRLSFCGFESAEIRTLEFDTTRIPEEEAVERLMQALACQEKLPAAVQFYAAGNSTNISSTLKKISDTYPDLPIFGTLAADVKWEAGWESYIYGEQKINYGYIFNLFYGDDLQIQMSYIEGWQVLGRELPVEVRKIRDSHGIGDCILKKIDGHPAVEIYERYLKVRPDAAFVANTMEFPLALERDGMVLYRVPYRYDNVGELYFSADIRDGEKLRFAYSTPKYMAAETERRSQEMVDFQPEAIFLYGGLSRNTFLGRYAHVETEYFQRINPNTKTCNGMAQIFSWQGKSAISNGCLVAVGLREGIPAGEENHSRMNFRSAGKDEIIPLKERITTLMSALADDLKDAVVEAEQANEAKSRFLSNMSHEIRTPINTIMGMDEMILRESRDETALHYAGDIQSASASLLGIVNDILDFSKIEAGRLSIIPVEYSTAQILNDLVLMVQKRAEDKNLKLELETDSDIPKNLYGDEIRIKQIITNLLTNAVKYTEKGTVKLKTSYKKRNEEEIELFISVKDTGIGIKQEDMEKLFTAFERIEEKRNRTIEGTGLGMNITLQLLHLMGSELNVESVYGEGSEFSFSLRQKVMNWEPMGELSLQRHREQGRVQEAAFVSPESEILVVDDTAMNLVVMKSLLRQNKVKVDTAGSGMEAVEMVQKKHYDLIFLDFRMPGMDGIETLKKMQELPDSPCQDTPAICLTANAVSGAREQYLAAGFLDMLSKPVVPEQLEKMMMHYLPKEKLHDPKSFTETEAEEELPEEAKHEEGELQKLQTIPELDIETGIQNCGTEEDYLTVVKIFMDSMPESSALIEQLFTEGDIPNYTIKVHALKSSARIIGAMELSELARALEAAGNEGDIDKILDHTLELLEMYRDLGSRLKKALSEESPEEASEEELAEMSDADWQDAKLCLQEFAYGYDLPSVEMILERLRHYRIPEESRTMIEAFREAAAKLDWEKMQELVQDS